MTVEVSQYDFSRDKRDHIVLYCVAVYQYKNEEGCTTRELFDNVNLFDNINIVSAYLSRLQKAGLLNRVKEEQPNGGPRFVYSVSPEGEKALRTFGEPSKLPDGTDWNSPYVVNEIIGNGQEVFENEREITELQPSREIGKEEYTNCNMTEEETVTFGLPPQEQLVEAIDQKGLSLYSEAIENGSLSVAELYTLAENLED